MMEEDQPKEEDQTEDDNLEEGGEGAEDGEDGEGDGDDAGSGGKKKLIIIIVAAVVLLLGIVGAGLYFTGMLDSILGGGTDTEHAEGADEHGDKSDHADKGKDSHGGGHGEAGAGGFVPIPTMIVNLNTEDDVPRYLRLTVQLELEDPSEKAAVEAVIPRVVDQFQTYLRELRVKDLRGSAGIYRLQMELLWRVNQAAAPVEIKDVLFQEILIQ